MSWMSKGKKGKKNKKDNRNRKNNSNNRNEFTQHPDSRDKENVPADKKKSEENLHERKSKKNPQKKSKKKSCFGRIIEGIMIALIAGIIATVIGTVIMSIIDRYFLSPRHIDISTSQDGLVGHVNIDQHDEECKIYFMDSNRSLIINLDNNSDMFMHITDICVNVKKCTDIMEEDIIIEVGEWSGDINRYIYLKTKIEHHTGKMEVEIDQEHNSEDDTVPDSYITIPSNTGERFILSMDFEKQGYYNIEVEFNYIYDGKKRTIKTEPLNYIFLEKDMKDR